MTALSAAGVPGAGRPGQVAEQASLWDARYAATGPNHLFGFRPNDFLASSEILLKRRSRVLVMGDGEGRNGVWLAQRGHQVTSVDLSSVAVGKARAWASEKGVDIDAQVGDLVEWLADDHGRWDAVISIFCHLPPADRVVVAKRCLAAMNPGARLVLEAYTPAQIGLGTGGPRDEQLLLTRQRVQDDWAGLDLEIALTERRIFEGAGHQGLSSVIQVLGIKPTRPRRASRGA